MKIRLTKDVRPREAWPVARGTIYHSCVQEADGTLAVDCGGPKLHLLPDEWEEFVPLVQRTLPAWEREEIWRNDHARDNEQCHR